MADNPLGDFFLSDGDDDAVVPVIAPVGAAPHAPAPAPTPVVPAPAPAPAPTTTPMPPAPAGSMQADMVPSPVSAPVPTPAGPAPVAAPAPAAPRLPSREERLATALNRLMEDSQEIEASALVSLDGFTMASALPVGMQEDRVGAMSAAILGLGERAAAELGKGQLTQVFIEGEHGYVMLIAAGDRAVLTCLAGHGAKLGLVLYDMRVAAGEIAEILG